MAEQPKLLVKESEKNASWVEKHLMYRSSIFNDKYFDNDIDCWGYYHNRSKDENYEYLTKIGDSDLPTKVVRVPQQRPYIDRLVSQQARRPFAFSIELADKNSIEEKYIDQINDYIDAIESNVEFINFETKFQIQQIQEQITQMQQTAQMQPQSAEQAQQINEIKKVLPQIINKFQYSLSMLDKKSALEEEQIKQLKNYHKYEKKDWKEIVAQNTAIKLRTELDINTESTTNFKNDCVLGRQYYYVDYIEGHRLPVFQSINPSTVTYPLVSSVKWVQDGDWVKITDYAAFNDVAINYGKQIEDKYGNDKLSKLQDKVTSTNASMLYGRKGEAYFNNNYLYSGSDDGSYGIKVERIWFKVPRNIKVKYTPNPFEDGVYFRHFIQNKEIISLDEWYYKDGFYFNKKNPKDIRNENEVDTVKPKKGEKYKDKYTYDLYFGVVIDNDIIVNEGKLPLVLRDIDNHGKINLPVFGKTYSSITDQPYSLIMATKDLQEIYDVVHAHQQLMLALSGTKTILFDAAYKPPDMPTDEWEYEKKKGVVHVESITKDGRAKQSPFNQWQMFDLSVSNSIGVLEQLKESITTTMGEVMGIPRQMKGQMINTDQVGTYNASIKQAALITEIRFAEHDLIEAKALTHCINLALNYCYKDGEIFGINNSDLSSEIVNIPPNVLNKVRFNCIVANNTEEAQGVEDMKQLILANWNKGGMQFGDVVDLWGIKTLTEMKEKSKYLAEKAQQIQMMMANNAQEAEVEKEKLKIQLNNELLAPWKEQELKLKEMELQVKQGLGQLNAQILSQKNAILQQQVEKDTQIKAAKIQNERITEDNAIAVNDKHLSNDEQIRMLQIQVNSLLDDAKQRREDIVSRMKHKNESQKNMILSQKQEAMRSNKGSNNQ